jgi:hypothetical protein
MSDLKPYQRRALALLFRARSYSDLDAVHISRTTKVDDDGLVRCLDWRSVDALVALGLAARLAGLNRCRLTEAGYDLALQITVEQAALDLGGV